MQLLASEEYGLRCLLRVASAGQSRPVSISSIARDEGLSPEYTAKLMRELRLGALVKSVRGAEGGYGDFFPDSFCACHGGQKSDCVRSGDCSIRALWRTVKAALRETLERITLEDLRRNEQAMGSWLDPITLLPTTTHTEAS
jgi:DNA-binding IscR family transcriptional regulator